MIQNSLLNNKISYMVACVSSFASVFVEDMAEICRQNGGIMILYHGSNVVVKEINLEICKPFRDFGKGFYLTEI